MDSQDKDLLNSGSEGLDTKKLLSSIINHWYLFVIGVVVCFSFAFIYARYVTPDYNITSKVIIDDQSKMPGGGSGQGMIDFSDLFDLPSNADNEIEVLMSRSLMAKVVNDMHLNITTFRRGRIRAIELYDEMPFIVNVIPKKDTIESRLFQVEVKGDKLSILEKKDDIKTNATYDKVLPLSQYNLLFTKNPAATMHDGKYEVIIQSPDSRVEALSTLYNAALTDKKSTTIALTFKYPNPKKGEKILQTLMENYLKSNLQNKIQIADSTLSFIDKELGLVSGQLTGVEKQLEQYKEQNQLANPEEQSKALVGDASTYYNKANEIDVQLAVVDDIKKYINNSNSSTRRIIPSSLTVQDPVFAAVITRYNELLLM